MRKTTTKYPSQEKPLKLSKIKEFPSFNGDQHGN